MPKELKVHWYAPYWHIRAGTKGIMACGRPTVTCGNHILGDVYEHVVCRYWFMPLALRKLTKTERQSLMKKVTCNKCRDQLRRISE